MANVSIIEGFQPKNDPVLLEKAESLKPELKVTTLTGSRMGEEKALKEGDQVRFDFGNHQVGYVTLHLSHQGSHPDAPAFIKLKFAERAEEMDEDSSEYEGWISRGWIQEEWLHIDQLPAEVRLPRRYAFRYIQIDVLATSLKYQLKVDRVTCEAVSAVSMEDLSEPLQTEDELLKKIDQVSIRTLMNCMQDVFEDGPKRDRRLWIGDLRLQAKANYKTFKNYDLVKRCLYLFAGSRFPDGRVSANIFTDGEVEADDSYLADYALFFVPLLAEYYAETKDQEALDDLYGIAMEQIDIVMRQVGEDGVVKDGENGFWCFIDGDDEGDAEKEGGNGFWCFIDWNNEINKQASFQGILIYSLRYALKLAQEKQDAKRIGMCRGAIELLVKGAKEKLFDKEEMVFVSGKARQVSTASQAWMVLAQVFDQETNRKILRAIREKGLPYHMATPYMMHHYCEALIQSGEKEEAMKVIKGYWGKMIEMGADTFWETFNPEDPEESPYGGSMVNSYCHAWSCTPAYLLREYEF